MSTTVTHVVCARDRFFADDLTARALEEADEWIRKNPL